ncbi:MAG: sigma 54-interacting transcriptional regulator [Deltaproteobacteria bacterium]
MSQTLSDKPRILYVDDERENLVNFKYVFRKSYEIHLALSGEEAYEVLKQHDIQLVIADQKMPEETGVEFLERIAPEYPHAIRIILTGYSDINAVVHAINRSKIYYYLQKPWNEDEMRLVVDNALHAYRSNMEQTDLLDGLKQARDELGKEVTRLRRQVEEKTRLLEEIRKSGEQLKISEERLSAIFEAAQDCIFVKDKSLRYTHLNPSMLKLFRVESGEIIGRTDERLLGEDLANNLRSLEARVLAGQPMEAEYTVELNGSHVVLSSTRTPVRDASGSIVGICGILRDVTDRRQKVSCSRSAIQKYTSPTMKSALRHVLLAARSDSTVLFLGESGSGKDFLARYLHDNSPRSGGPFFAINCAALSPELVESELFGHEPGSFTGCTGRKRGLVELAEGGTLLLNEIGELALPIQAKLLAFLDTKRFTRVGGEQSVAVNARIVAATNKDLTKEVQSGGFRQDLYYRLNVFPVVVPSLRDRIEDLAVLVPDLLSRLAAQFGLSTIPLLEPHAMEALAGYHWPGNVRELENVLERALILSGSDVIAQRALTVSQEEQAEFGGSSSEEFVVSLSDGLSLNHVLDQTKQFLISQGLRRCEGNVTKAAAMLGISRGSLKHYMSRLQICRP